MRRLVFPAAILLALVAATTTSMDASAQELSALEPPIVDVTTANSAIELTVTNPNDRGQCIAVVVPSEAELEWENYIWPTLGDRDDHYAELLASLPGPQETKHFHIAPVAAGTYDVIGECWDGTVHPRTDRIAVTVTSAPSFSGGSLMFGS